MRPKKKVLLMDADEDRRGVRRLVLETHGYRVIEAGDAVELAAELTRAVDVVLLVCPFAAHASTVAERAHGWFAPVVAIADCESERLADVWCDRLLTGGECGAAGVLEAVRFGAARKPGPRKKMVTAVRALAESVEEERIKVVNSARRGAWAAVARACGEGIGAHCGPTNPQI